MVLLKSILIIIAIQTEDITDGFKIVLFKIITLYWTSLGADSFLAELL